MATGSALSVDLARHTVENKARDLYRKLGAEMTWSDRDKGFDEWDNLGDALKALNIAREKERNA